MEGLKDTLQVMWIHEPLLFREPSLHVGSAAGITEVSSKTKAASAGNNNTRIAAPNEPLLPSEFSWLMLDNDVCGFLLYQNDLLLLFVCTMTMQNYEPGRIAYTRDNEPLSS